TPKQESGVPRCLRRTPKLTVSEQRLDLGGEEELSAIVIVVQRFDAEGIAGEQESSPGPIPDRKRVHAAQPVHHVFTVFGVQMQKNLGIALRAKHAAPCFKVGPELAVIVNFAVK